MYKNYQIKIIKNDKKITTDSDSESDYEYLYDDELQILNESNKVLYNLKGYEFKSYELIDDYLILDIDEGHKFSEKILIINLDTFEKYYQIFNYNDRCYYINFDKNDKKILFNHNKKYDIKYFFENKNKIIEEYEIERHTFDTTKDTLLKSIFIKFNKSVDNDSQIKIDGFTYGMSCYYIDIFKNILRDNDKTLEKQLMETLFGYAIKYNHKIYDLELTIHYKDNNVDKHFSIKIECKNKVETHTDCGIVYYGEYDSDAKLQIIE